MEFEHLIYTRKAKGLSQESMAEKAGMKLLILEKNEVCRLSQRVNGKDLPRY